MRTPSNYSQMASRRLGVASFTVLLITVVASVVQAAPPPAVELARDGRAALPVVVAEDASEEVRDSAQILADYLGRITGATFELTTGDGKTGIAIGLAEDFPSLNADTLLTAQGAEAQEQYLLQSHKDGVYLIGASSLAVQHGVWDMLHRLGYRQFFPAPAWEIVPEQANLFIAVDALETPDYHNRRIWYSYNSWPENREALATWSARNRMVNAFDLNTGHAYGNIIRSHKEAFDAHPEYYALVNGERQVKPQAKLCISNAQVRQLTVDYALAHFQRNPDSETVSVDPSDGGGWCECEPCAAIGSPSDLALTLANTVAQALEQAYPDQDKFVAMYAYNQHSAPPSIKAHPRVIINAATAFIKGGTTIDRIIEGWKNQGVERFGIREYYSIIHWDKDLPAASRGARLDYLTHTIPHFHAMGARYLTSESSENWGPNGLGYYVASRMLWDVDEAQRVDEIVADFLDKSFGQAREPMAEFYAILNGDQSVMLSEHLVGRMYRLLDAACQLSSDPSVHARLDHLTLYTRYLELYRAYQAAGGAARQQAFEDVIRHSYRIRDTSMVHSLAQYRTGFRDKSVQTPPEAHWQKDEETNPWKSSEPFTQEQIQQIISEGIGNNQLRAFDPLAFSHDLIPATPLALTGENLNVQHRHQGRGSWHFYTWITDAPRTLTFNVTGGLIQHYRDRGAARLELQQWDDEDAQYITIDQGETQPDGETRVITLTAKSAGRHRLVLSDGMDMTAIEWPANLPWTIESSTEHANQHPSGRRHYYLYVPRGTQVVGGYAPRGLVGALHNAQGEVMLNFDGEQEAEGFVHAAVLPGQDGQLWTLREISGGAFQLMTVPPYLAQDPAALLLPAEVVQRDASSE